ncbi:MAG: methyltransferase, partial [Nanoarchaeota archaeon]|nr:methyltransferase [Nanoarchaeota archaeon]
AHGIVLDMGTGSGIQAVEAAKSRKVVRVYAVDVDRGIIRHCKEKIVNKKIKFLTSNLFSAFEVDQRFKGIKFDTIVFNAPYLPDDEGIEDAALYGGKQGHELITLFLNKSRRFIKPTTDILLVFSSATGKETLDNWLIKNHYSFKETAKEHIFFEDIFVYLIKKD